MFRSLKHKKKRKVSNIYFPTSTLGLYSQEELKSSFAKTDKHHLGVDLNKPPCEMAFIGFCKIA